MQQPKFEIAALILIILLFGPSCKNKKGEDSGRKVAVKSYPPDFLELGRQCINDSSGKVDTNRIISLALIRHFLKNYIDTSFHGTATPLMLDKEPGGYIFILKMNGSAADSGVQYYRIDFNDKGKFIENRKLRYKTTKPS